MKEKTNHFFRQIINAVILAGIIVFFIGLYYWMIKAGIPYQDPTLELQIKYAIDIGIGETLLEKGFGIAVCGGLTRLLFEWILKKQQKKQLSDQEV